MSTGSICEEVSVDMARIQMPVSILEFVSREIDILSLLPLYYGFRLNLHR